MGVYGALVMWALPVVCVGGLCLNLLCGLLFLSIGRRCRRRDRNRDADSRGLRVFLVGLCGFDALQLLLSLLVIVVPEVEGLVGERRGLHQVGAFAIRFLYPLLMSAHYASIWTICAICAIRYAAVCHPLASRHKCHLLRRQRTMLSLISLAALALNLPRFFEFSLLPAEDPSLGFDLDLSPLRRSRLYLVVNDGLLYPFFVYLLPLALLSFLYKAVYSAMHRSGAGAQRARLSTVSVLGWREAGGKDSLARRRDGASLESRSGLMLATIVLLFFACHSLTVALRWWEVGDARLTSTEPESSTYRLLNLVSNVAVLANSAANPFVYFFFTPLFHSLKLSLRLRTKLPSKGPPYSPTPILPPHIRTSTSSNSFTSLGQISPRTPR